MPLTMVEQEAVGQVRALTADLDPAKPLLSDEQLHGFITLYDGNVKRAAARALRTVAVSEVLVAKKITTQDLSTDGPSLSKELRALADDLWAEAEADDAAEAAEGDPLAWFLPHGPSATVEGEEWRWGA